MQNQKRRRLNRSSQNNKYAIKDRIELIRQVLQQGFSITKAGDSLGFKRSTAKKIVQIYRLSGKLTIFMNQKLPGQEITQNDSEIQNQTILENRVQNSISQIFNKQEGLIYYQNFSYFLVNWTNNSYNWIGVNQTNQLTDNWQFSSYLNYWYFT